MYVYVVWCYGRVCFGLWRSIIVTYSWAGKRHGTGVYMSVKGHRYEGNWVNDMRNVRHLLWSSSAPVSTHSLVFGLATPRRFWHWLVSTCPLTQSNRYARVWWCLMTLTEVNVGIIRHALSPLLVLLDRCREKGPCFLQTVTHYIPNGSVRLKANGKTIRNMAREFFHMQMGINTTVCFLVCVCVCVCVCLVVLKD